MQPPWDTEPRCDRILRRPGRRSISGNPPMTSDVYALTKQVFPGIAPFARPPRPRPRPAKAKRPRGGSPLKPPRATAGLGSLTFGCASGQSALLARRRQRGFSIGGDSVAKWMAAPCPAMEQRRPAGSRLTRHGRHQHSYNIACSRWCALLGILMIRVRALCSCSIAWESRIQLPCGRGCRI